MSENDANSIYIGVNVVGVVIGFYLANVIDVPAFAALFVVISGSLYWYANHLKQSFLLGNVIVSLLVALSVLVIGIFDLYPVVYAGNQSTMRVFFGILFDYAMILFCVNLMREIVKDLEDLKGDKVQRMKTFSIVMGEAKATKVLALFTLFPVAGITYYVLTYLPNLHIANIYILLTIVGPLVYFAIKIWTAREKSEFTLLSNLLKIVMLLGVVSVGVITCNMLS